MKEQKQVVTKNPEKLPTGWFVEIIEQAKEDKKRVERFLFASIGINVILAAVVVALVLR